MGPELYTIPLLDEAGSGHCGLCKATWAQQVFKQGRELFIFDDILAMVRDATVPAEEIINKCHNVLIQMFRTFISIEEKYRMCPLPSSGLKSKMQSV